jgi:hypothetical protein
VASKLATLIACKINKFYVMKNLDLNAMGVVEMTEKEIKTINGGESDAASLFFGVIGTQLGVVGVVIGVATGGVGFALLGLGIAAASVIAAGR